MICIYSQNNTEYTKNGDAVLIPTKCEVSMTINGVWQMTLEHPYDPEERYKYIIEGAVVRCDIKCIRELPTVQQRFRIYTYTKGLHGITAIGFPVAMESTYDAPIDNLVISNKTGAQAMAALQAFTNKYTLSTDVTKTASASMANTNINSAIASGANNSFIYAWGGEILYSNYDYMVKSRLGDDTAADHRIIYGRNLTNIEYKKDDSGLTTRIYPISGDGIRLNGTGYVDSAHASDYPVIHHRFMTAPYNLVDTDASSSSATAQQTRTSLAAISTAASTLSQGVDRSAYPPEYIKQQKNDIIAAVQTMALTGVVSTSLYNAAAKTIADAMAWMNDLAQPEWDWMGSYEDGWKYGDTNGYAVNQYIKIGKKWCYFGSNGNWQEPADSSNDWNWYQSTEETGKRYGDFSRYYAHNEYVFITIDGQLKQYWFDKEGWYDEDKSGDSDYAWNGSGTAEDPWWFGESSSKYLKSCWAFIDGTYYFFDEYGYYDGSTKFNDWQWDWVDDGANPWFGNPDKTYAAIYLTNQWCKIDGAWYYFDNDGYAYDTNAARADVISLYTTGMAALATTVGTQSTALYDLLYSLMTSYAQSKYAQGVDMPVITIKVNMADLSKTTEYAGYENLETIKLGDSVECIDDEHDISTTNRVIGITYDVLRDYNSEVTIGSATASVASIIGNANGQAVTGGFDTSAIEAQLDALQDKVGDVVFNEISLVENGVAQFKIQAGENINITRSGKTWTIRAAGGGNGDVNLYHGIEAPSNSLGDDNDIYILMGHQMTDLLYFDASYYGSAMRDYHYQRNGNKWNITTTFVNATLYHSFVIWTVNGLTVGKTYTISFDYQNDGVPPLYSMGELFGLTIQHNMQCIDMRSYVSELVEDGEFKYFENQATYGEFWYQSFPNDARRHHYEFQFTARNTYEYIGFYGDRTSGYLTCSMYELCVGDRTQIAEIKDVYYKLDGSWLIDDSDLYLPFVGATASTDGEDGLVPAPLIADKDKFLKGDGTWSTPPDTTYDVFEAPETSQDMGVNGLVPAPTYAEVQANKVLQADGTWVEQTGGTEVEANPSGTATDTLQTVGIDGTIYEIQGGGGGSNLIVDAQIYSLEEKQVGVWTDGKPIYKRTWLLSNEVLVNSNGVTISEIDASMIEHLIGCNGGYQPLSNTKSIPILVWKYNNTWYYGSSINAYIDTVTLTYTKTTDTAGSGGFQAYGFSPVIYSTEEREVGVWTDGKPLYQKTFDCGALLNAQTKEVSFNEDMETATIIDAFAMSTSEGYVISLPDVVPNYVAGSVRIYVSKTAKKIYIYSQADMRTYDKSYVTIQYTKTTDVAGSGKYNTLGVPAVHYTTDEQVIGTWIDGKPIYQKTFVFENAITLSNPNTWYSTPIVRANYNMDKIIDAIAYSPTLEDVYKGITAEINSGQYLQVLNYRYALIQTLTVQYTKTTD